MTQWQRDQEKREGELAALEAENARLRATLADLTIKANAVVLSRERSTIAWVEKKPNREQERLADLHITAIHDLRTLLRVALATTTEPDAAEGAAR